MCKNILNRDFSLVKEHRREGTFLSWKILKVGIFYPKCLKSTSNVMKILPEVKKFASSQNFSGDSKFKIMDYLPCPCKLSIQNYGINVLFLSDFQTFCCTFYDKLIA